MTVPMDLRFVKDKVKHVGEIKAIGNLRKDLAGSKIDRYLGGFN
jgi:hypothetical protein